MSVTIQTSIHFTRGKAGRKKVAVGPAPEQAPAPPDPIPRISRLMALAIHFDGLIREGVVRDYADLARLGGVSRARITQIMNLLNLPPWTQEELLFWEGEQGRAGLTEREMRVVAAELVWKTHRNHSITQRDGEVHDPTDVECEFQLGERLRRYCRREA